MQADDDAPFRAMRRQPTHAPGMMTRAQVVAYYGARTGLDVSGFAFYEVFGLFRLMGIIQQIYRRYVLGQTTNPAFAGFGDAVRYLNATLPRAHRRGRGARMSEIVLIRHAQASFGAADYDHLSPRGEAQAAKLGAWMAARGARPTAIVTGTLRRHAQTARLCAAAAGIADAPRRVLPGLDELDADELIARHRPELAARDALLAERARAADPRRAFQVLFASAVARWISGAADADYALAWPAFRANVQAAWDALARDGGGDGDGGEIWVVSSGGPIAVIVAALVGADPARTFEFAWPLVNTSVSRICGARLITYNAWPHLDAAADAALVTHR